MLKPVSMPVIRQALAWQGITCSKIRVLSSYEDHELNQLASFLLIFTREDFQHFASSHGLDWREVMTQEFVACVESCFCADFGPWEWSWNEVHRAICGQVEYLLFADQRRDTRQLELPDLSWLIGDPPDNAEEVENVSPF
jgi:hypothetical protein